jgi:hypothetical protein
VSALTAAAPGLYADDPRSFGMPLKGADDPADPAGEQGPVATGHVFVGLADILGLEMAADIRSTRGAEAGVFDPALVKLLAKSYSLGEPEGSSLASAAAGSAASLSDVAKACKRNLDAATAAGLKCRAAVWSTVLTLLPLPQFTCKAVSDSFPSSSSSSSLDHLQVPFASELLGSLLLELLEGGDCQHFTVLCELLRRAGLLEAATLSGGISKVQTAHFDSILHHPILLCYAMLCYAMLCSDVT